MNYEPKEAKVAKIWKGLSQKAREARLSRAKHRNELIKALGERGLDESERSTASRLDADVDRTTIRRWRERYEKYGIDGLIDQRVGPHRMIPEEVRVAIRTLRRADPNIAVEYIVKHVKQHHGVKPSGSTVKQILREAGLNRRPGPPKGSVFAGESRLELGGMKLLEAACVETGYVKALTQAVMGHVKDLPMPENSQEPNKSGRDAYGRFNSAYNERYRKKPDDVIGPGFTSVLVKRKDMDPDRFEISKASEAVIERKLFSLIASPMISGGRWDGMRVSRAEKYLQEICGVSYMPATLDKFSRELKYAGVANTLWEVHARFWLAQTKTWADPRRAAVMYVDGTTKPIWTNLFSQATKVSQVGRTMPGLEKVAFHSGYGVPLWMLTHSGRAPLVKIIPEAINQLNEICGTTAIGRIVVIDAEGNSIPFVKGLEQGEPSRAWVTRLRDDWVKGKRIFNRKNYRPYRNGDRVRKGVADFNDPEGGTFRMQVIEVERRTSEKVAYLGASLKLNQWKATDLADLYFDRWPSQEANFRAVNQAAGFKDMHGYGKQLVDNISVITEQDDLSRKTKQEQERLMHRQGAAEKFEKRVKEENRTLNRQVRRQATVQRNIEARIKPGRPITGSLKKLVDEQSSLSNKVSQQKERLDQSRSRCEKANALVERTKAKLSKYREQEESLKDRTKIFAHDVELDSLFSVFKVGLVLLVTYVLREYFGNARMDAITFLERVATLPARLRMTPELEIVTFEYNARDPDVMFLLEKYSQSINNRGLLTRNNRKLRIQVEPAPAPARQPPSAEKRCKSNCRFVR
jgi:transposase